MEQFIFEDGNLSAQTGGKRILIIEGEEHFHLSRVLRVRIGESILATNGKGTTCLCAVADIDRSKSVCEVMEEYHDLNCSLRRYCIGMAMLRPLSKLELAIEKCTELGASRFVLFNCERGESAHPRPDRLRAIIRSAVKQSLQSRIPELTIVGNLKEAVAASESFDRKMVLHEKAVEAIDIDTMLPDGTESVVAYVGPEGGFSENEIQFLLQNGFRSLSVGKARLRSETAAMKVSSLLATY